MPDPSDLELVSLSRQGNKAAFNQLVLRYQPMAQRLAIKIIGNQDLAQELVQDALLQAYLSLEKLNDPKCFKSWLYGIVLNICRNDLRHRKVICLSLEEMIGSLADEGSPLTERSPNPQQWAEQKERHMALQEAVNALSPKNRSAILLFYHRQFSLQEVANRLNISVGAVKGRLHKSRRQLRAQLSRLQDQFHPNLSQESKSMTTKTSTPIKQELCCSFCHKRNEEVDMLIAGPGVFICNICVDICNQIISQEIPPNPLTQEQVETLLDSGKLSD
ncbi:MAG: sigma-70 family RNA polymerase sigma factor [Cyanobacteria bacterium P01_A01_bin.123]